MAEGHRRSSAPYGFAPLTGRTNWPSEAIRNTTVTTAMNTQPTVNRVPSETGSIDATA